MRLIVIILLQFIIVGVAHSQYSAKVTKGESFADLNIKISSDLIMEDLSVEFSEEVLLEDFKIGFTSFESEADVIIRNYLGCSDHSFRNASTTGNNADFEVNMVASFADIEIEMSDDVLMQDVGIEIIRNGYVHYLIYNDKPELTRQELICAILPIINLYLKESDRLEEVPTYLSKNTSCKFTTGGNSGLVLH